MLKGSIVVCEHPTEVGPSERGNKLACRVEFEIGLNIEYGIVMLLILIIQIIV